MINNVVYEKGATHLVISYAGFKNGDTETHTRSFVAPEHDSKLTQG